MSLVQVQRSPSPSLLDDEESLDFDDSRCSSRNRSLSECYFAVRGAALILPHSESSPSCSHSVGDSAEIEPHLQLMTRHLRQQDSIKMAVRLQTAVTDHVRYLAVVCSQVASSSFTLLLGIDYYEGIMTVGMVIPLVSCSTVRLVGDGAVCVGDSQRAEGQVLFRPVSVQAMWCVFQTLHREVEKSQDSRHFCLQSVCEHYTHKIASLDFLVSQWHQSAVVEEEELELKADTVRDRTGTLEEQAVEADIRTELRNIMQNIDRSSVIDIPQRMFKFLFALSILPTISGDLCVHCDCDISVGAVSCSDQSFLLRTVSLLPWADSLLLNRLTLPHPPHFLYHAHLRILRINNCGLEDLSPHTLLPLPNLQVVSLANNRLSSLPATLFRSLTKLKVIDISHNRIEDLSSIEWNLFDGLKLDVLDIGNNPIKMSTRTSTLPPSKQLILSNMNMERMNTTTFVFAQSSRCSETNCRVLPVPDLSDTKLLDISDNDVVLDAYVLEKLSNITHLNLAHSRLPASFPYWLERSKVEVLNISHSTIELDDEEWTWCGHQLHTLDISGLKLKRLRLGRDCGLRRLFARDNVLESVVLEAPYLEALHLDRNLFTDWPALPPGTVLDALETLSLSGNLLSNLPAHSLSQFPALQHIDLSRNQLSNIDPAAFPSLGMNLISIDLSSNQLTRLVHPVLPSLLFLDVSNNDLHEISPLLFAGMPLLQHLRLGSNPSLFASCSTKCWSDHLDVLTNLVDLDLSSCSLSQPLHLSHLSSLRVLLLRGNQLSSLDGNELPPVISILDAGENRIHRTTNFSSLHSLRELRLDSNPLMCDCSLFQIRHLLLNQSSIADPNSYYCFSSSWQYPLLPYIETMTTCREQPAQVGTVAASVLAGCLILVLVLVLAGVLLGRCLPQFKHQYKRLYSEFPVRL